MAKGTMESVTKGWIIMIIVCSVLAFIFKLIKG